MDAARGAYNDVLALSQLADVLTDNSSTDASVHFKAKELADGMNDKGNLHGKLSRWRDDQRLRVVAGGVEALQSADGEGTGLASS